MSVTSFISKKFNSGRNLPRSLVVMRVISVAGIVLSVASLIIATSIGRGFESRYKKALMDFNSHVVVMGIGEITSPAEVVSKLKTLKESLGIDALTTFVYREVLLAGGGVIKGAVVKGIDPATFASVNPMSIRLFDGSLKVSDALRSKDSSARASVIVGAGLKGMWTNDHAVKMFIPEESGKMKGKTRFVPVDAAGIFESGVYDYDAQFLLMDETILRKLFGIAGSQITGIEIKLFNPLTAEEVARKIDNELGPAFKAVAWNELNHDLMAAVNLEKLMSIVIMGLMVFVALLNIVAVLTLTMLNRQAEVSALMALGLGPRRLLNLFIRGGIRVVIVGVVLGLIIGIFFSLFAEHFRIVPLEAEIYLVNFLPFDISFGMCSIFALACLFVGLLTSATVARRLAALPVAEGLKQV